MSDPQPPAGLTRTVVRGVGFAGTGFVLTQVLTLVSYIALARVATPADFGEFAAGSIVTGLGMLVVESGMLAALVHYRGEVDEAASTAFAATMLGGILLSLGALAAAPLIGLYFGSRRIELVAAAMAGYMVLRESVVVPNALLQRSFSFVRRLVLEPVAVAVFGTTAVVGCSYGLGVWGLVAGAYAAAVADAALAWAVVSWRPDLRRVSFQMWRRLVGYGRLVLAADIVGRAGAEMSTVLVGRFVGTAALGQFQYASRVAQRPLSALVDSASYVLFPAFARIADDEPRLQQAFLRSLRWMCVVAFPVSLVLLPLGAPAVVLVFGEQWRVAGHALMAMCGYAAGRSFLTLAANAAKATGRPDALLRLHAVAATLAVAAMAALLPLGVVGVAGGLSLSSVGVAAYSLVWIRRLVGIPFRRLSAAIWPPFAAAAVMACGLYAIDRYALRAGAHRPLVAGTILVLEALGGGAIYLSALAVLSPATARDVRSALVSLVTRSRRDPGAAEVAKELTPLR